MRIYKDTPFEVTHMTWELEPRRTTAVMIVKGTFSIAEGVCPIAPEQVPCLGEVAWPDADRSLLRTESDYAVLKPGAEWYLVGTAYSGPTPATVVPVMVRVGELQKRLAVFGDRTWERGLLGSRPSAPAPFTSMPLRWDRCFGGPGVPENPAGRGTQSIATESGSVIPLPNIEDPRRPTISRDDTPTPFGMFPIHGTWASRRARSGTYDETWKRTRWPYFPRDFDFRFFHCAPEDQWKNGYWRGDEAIELVGLHPVHRHLRTRLPGLRARLFVERATPGAPLPARTPDAVRASARPRLEEVHLQLDTIAIDADAGVITCQWRGLLEVADRRLGDVARLFAIHEPLDVGAPRAHYEEWLHRKLLEEAEELEGHDELPSTPAHEADVAVLTPAPESELELAMARLQDEMVGFLGHLAPVEAALPPIEAARAHHEELGLDAAALLPDPEPPELPEDEDARSVLRLAAIVRRKLGISFRDLDLSNAPYSRLDLRGADFSNSILTGAELREAWLEGACFDGALLARADLERADLGNASLQGADLSDARAVGARFEGARLDEATGSDVVLRGARMAGASLRGADLEGCDLSGADLRGGCLDGADLTGGVLEGANLLGASLVDTSLEGVRGRGACFERCRMPDLRASDGADFSEARFVLVDAPRAQLQGTTLHGASFAGANLEEADFCDAVLSRANLVHTVLRRAKLDRADLREASMLQADLFEASLEDADLRAADLRAAHAFSAHTWRARTEGALLEGTVLERTLLG